MTVFSSPASPSKSSSRNDVPRAALATIVPPTHSPLVASKLDHSITADEDEEPMDKTGFATGGLVGVRDIRTPLMGSRVRSIDVPSSLEKFKSLKLGLSQASVTKEERHSIKAEPVSPFAVPPILLNQANQTKQSAVPKEPFSFTTSHIKTEKSEIPAPIGDIQMQKAAMREVLDEFKATLRNDLQCLHVELIKQSMVQQESVRETLESFLPAVRELMDEVSRVREENERLKLLLYKQ